MAGGFVVADSVNSANDTLNINIGRFSRLHDRLVVDGDVVNDVRVYVLAAIHAFDTVTHDVTNLVAVGRVEGHHRSVGRGNNGGVAIGVLKTLTGKSCAARGGADHEATRHLVRCRPNRIRGSLKTEHRVEDVNRNHRLAVSRIGRAGGREGGD